MLTALFCDSSTRRVSQAGGSQSGYLDLMQEAAGATCSRRGASLHMERCVLINPSDAGKGCLTRGNCPLGSHGQYNSSSTGKMLPPAGEQQKCKRVPSIM